MSNSCAPPLQYSKSAVVPLPALLMLPLDSLDPLMDERHGRCATLNGVAGGGGGGALDDLRFSSKMHFIRPIGSSNAVHPYPNPNRGPQSTGGATRGSMAGDDELEGMSLFVFSEYSQIRVFLSKVRLWIILSRFSGHCWLAWFS